MKIIIFLLYQVIFIYTKIIKEQNPNFVMKIIGIFLIFSILKEY